LGHDHQCCQISDGLGDSTSPELTPIAAAVMLDGGRESASMAGDGMLLGDQPPSSWMAWKTEEEDVGDQVAA